MTDAKTRMADIQRRLADVAARAKGPSTNLPEPAHEGPEGVRKPSSRPAENGFGITEEEVAECARTPPPLSVHPEPLAPAAVSDESSANEGAIPKPAPVPHESYVSHEELDEKLKALEQRLSPPEAPAPQVTPGLATFGDIQNLKTDLTREMNKLNAGTVAAVDRVDSIVQMLTGETPERAARIFEHVRFEYASDAVFSVLTMDVGSRNAAFGTLLKECVPSDVAYALVKIKNSTPEDIQNALSRRGVTDQSHDRIITAVETSVPDVFLPAVSSALTGSDYVRCVQRIGELDPEIAEHINSILDGFSKDSAQPDISAALVRAGYVKEDADKRAEVVCERAKTMPRLEVKPKEPKADAKEPTPSEASRPAEEPKPAEPPKVEPPPRAAEQPAGKVVDLRSRTAPQPAEQAPAPGTGIARSDDITVDVGPVNLAGMPSKDLLRIFASSASEADRKSVLSKFEPLELCEKLAEIVEASDDQLPSGVDPELIRDRAATELSAQALPVVARYLLRKDYTSLPTHMEKSGVLADKLAAALVDLAADDAVRDSTLTTLGHRGIQLSQRSITVKDRANEILSLVNSE